MLDSPTRVIAIDWSGRGGRDQSKYIWLAEVTGGTVKRLECGRSRGQVVRHLTDLAEHDPSLIVGLDFAFSLPEWFLRKQKIDSAKELWRLLADENLFPRMKEVGLRDWIKEPDWPFWNKKRPADLEPAMQFRRTELEVAVPGTQPKSAFQLVGAGQVGPGSLYGMQALDVLSRAGFSIGPFDEPKFPLVIEIFPRTLTGPVVKSDGAARARYLERFDLDSETQVKAISSDDAFDALVSAIAMNAQADDLRALRAEPEYALEGKIWQSDDSINRLV